MSAAESTQQQQKQPQLSTAEHGDAAPSKADLAGVQDCSVTTTNAAAVWRMRRLLRQHDHATTEFNVVARDSRDEVVSAAKRDSSPESDRRPAEDDAETDVGGFTELQAAGYCGPGRRWETEWTRIADVLDRFFFFLFMTLLFIPTVTILGIVRLFKPEL